jgi:diacylglycerol kinase
MIRTRQLFKSIRHALRGAGVVLRDEQNFRIQVLAGALVLLLAAVFDVRIYEWILLILLIGAVLTLELINSIIERLVDAFKPRLHPFVKDVKDIMAAAVLIASLIAAAVGITIFYPYAVALVSRLS